MKEGIYFSNLILLCDECHSIIDNKENESKYPVSLLREWKTNHESKRQSRLISNPSLLKLAINAIADAEFDHSGLKNDESLKPFEIENKISYNAVKRNKPLIEEYKIYYSKINSLYNELEEQGSFKKANLLRNIREIYLKAKGKYVEDSDNPALAIRASADSIIEDVENTLLELAENYIELYREDISSGIRIIMVDAFMRCKILEEPVIK